MGDLLTLCRDELRLAWTEPHPTAIGSRSCSGWVCPRGRRAWSEQPAGGWRMPFRTVASRGDLLRQSGRSVHTNIHFHQHLSTGLPDGGLAEPQHRGLVASSSADSRTASRAGPAGGEAVCKRATSAPQRGVIRCVWSGLGFSPEPVLPPNLSSSRNSSRQDCRAARSRQDPGLSRELRHCSRDRGQIRRSVVVDGLEPVDTHSRSDVLEPSLHRTPARASFRHTRAGDAAGVGIAELGFREVFTPALTLRHSRGREDCRRGRRRSLNRRGVRGRWPPRPCRVSAPARARSGRRGGIRVVF
jgi:hypothetical protein